MRSPEPRIEELARAAKDSVRNWPRKKAEMAIRAAGLTPGTPRESLEAIAEASGVSRETVRRARNELLHALESKNRNLDPGVIGINPTVIEQKTAESPATAVALRRMLTMTGPLPWDEMLAGWARGSGRYPYSPLPTDIISFRKWAANTIGIVVSDTEPVTVSIDFPEKLDMVSGFLNGVLHDQPDGVERTDILEAAEAAGLKPTTVATALSSHPAVLRRNRGSWALRGSDAKSAHQVPAVRPRQRQTRVRPTAFQWAADGRLAIDFSVPRGPSPVIAVPKAVAALVEGREFTLDGSSRPQRINVGNARLWGFGPRIAELGIVGGQRAQLLLNLIAGTAELSPYERQEL